MDIQRTKESILSDAISAISILDIKEHYIHNSNISLYIKTNNLKDINHNLLNNSMCKHNSKEIEISYIIPEFINHGNYTKENMDVVCIYIKSREQEEKYKC